VTVTGVPGAVWNRGHSCASSSASGVCSPHVTPLSGAIDGESEAEGLWLALPEAEPELEGLSEAEGELDGLSEAEPEADPLALGLLEGESEDDPELEGLSEAEPLAEGESEADPEALAEGETLELSEALGAQAAATEATPAYE